jgi:hypothetical protein
MNPDPSGELIAQILHTAAQQCAIIGVKRSFSDPFREAGQFDPAYDKAVVLDWKLVHAAMYREVIFHGCCPANS